jgi:hypothetical protein
MKAFDGDSDWILQIFIIQHNIDKSKAKFQSIKIIVMPYYLNSKNVEEFRAHQWSQSLKWWHIAMRMDAKRSFASLWMTMPANSWREVEKMRATRASFQPLSISCASIHHPERSEGSLRLSSDCISWIIGLLQQYEQTIPVLIFHQIQRLR